VTRVDVQPAPFRPRHQNRIDGAVIAHGKIVPQFLRRSDSSCGGPAAQGQYRQFGDVSDRSALGLRAQFPDCVAQFGSPP
jgi:hypothetical protein